MTKYEILLNILDKIRLEAPLTYTSYRPINSDVKGLEQALAKSYIHLYLKVRFGLLDFNERKDYVTDDTNDGGIDGYFIDEDAKTIYFIQSKFRINEESFKNKEITLREILKMDADRISKGETSYDNGTSYNGKIQNLIKKIQQIKDIGRYNYKVVILANLTGYKTYELKRLTGGFEVEVFNNERTYSELVLPVVSGTYFYKPELTIYTSTANKTSARIKCNVETGIRECEVIVIFVPAIEIAKALYKYKNSILKFNPRNYLEMKNNPVNKDIAETITSVNTNEFALFNNGLTLLSYNAHYSEDTGKKDMAQLIISQPQIINGGQTAFTLSRLYEDCLNGQSDLKIFENKEVLLKVITVLPKKKSSELEESILIESISKATNQQNIVDEADRRANDPIQTKIQQLIFNKYGYFYERKRGEFAEGIREQYINKTKLIHRDLFLRLCKSCDYNPSEARNSSKNKLFAKKNFDETLKDVDRVEEYFFAFQCLEVFNKISKSLLKDKNDRYGEVNYGNAFRYGKYAVISACRSYFRGEEEDKVIEEIVQKVLSRWKGFEKWLSQKATNKRYFKETIDNKTKKVREEMNFDNYYKGITLNQDLAIFFKYDLPKQIKK